MKKITVLLILSTFLLASSHPVKIGSEITIKESGMMESKKVYQDFCDDGYVWREYKSGRRGSYVQVFENVTIKLGESSFKVSQVKTCN